MIMPPHEAPDSVAHLWCVVTPRTATASSTGSAQTILGAWSTRICRGNRQPQDWTGGTANEGSEGLCTGHQHWWAQSRQAGRSRPHNTIVPLNHGVYRSVSMLPYPERTWHRSATTSHNNYADMGYVAVCDAQESKDITTDS